MAGKNWNSDTGTWSDVVKPETKALALRARELYADGNSIHNIARILRKSEARVRELLKD